MKIMYLIKRITMETNNVLLQIILSNTVEEYEKPIAVASS